jgi:hypothetical protein
MPGLDGLSSRTGLRPGPSPRTVRDDTGAVVQVPDGWVLLPPGDAAVTRAVKAAGPTWSVEEKRGRKVFSRGIWAPGATVERARDEVAATRSDPAWQRKLEAGRERRAREQAAYVLDFEAEVLEFLAFHPRHAAAAAELARRVTAHATPVGSGTVARTERIPVEERSKAAVIAWMRHQTTTYDDRVVPRIAGARRELRRELARESRQVLDRYRRGLEVEPGCPLAAALAEAQVDLVPPPPARPPAAPVRVEPRFEARATPETAKPETAKPEAAKPEAAKPETAKPRAAYGLATAFPKPPQRPLPARPETSPARPPRDPVATPDPDDPRARYLALRERLKGR